MSKNVNIAEGGHAKSASNVARLATELQAGGLCHWVPEDERLIRTKYINANGKYLASADAVYGFSKLTVNVPGGAAGATVPTFDEDGNSMSGTPADPTSPSWDPDTPTYGPVTVDSGQEPATIDPVSGGVGSSVVGIDPEDGNEYMAEVEEDEDGEEEITLQIVPSEIRVLNKPRKTKYTAGDPIDYTGIWVYLFDNTGNLFSYDPERYPGGRLPEEEIQFPVVLAPDAENYYTKVTSDLLEGIISGPLATAGNAVDISRYTSAFIYSRREHTGAAVFTEVHVPGRNHLIIAAKTLLPIIHTAQYNKRYTPGGPSDTIDGEYTYVATQDGRLTNSYTKDGKTVYYSHGSTYYVEKYAISPENDAIKDELSEDDAGRIAWTMLYGDVVERGARVEIPVRWRSTYDDRLLEATFEIEVNEKHPHTVDY